MKPRAWVLVLASAWAAGLPADATVTLLGASSVDQAWLSVDADPWVAALGGACALLGRGAANVAAAPARLDELVDPELSLFHNEWNTSLGMREEQLAYGRRAGDGAWGAGLRYFSYGTFDDRDASGAPLGSSSDYAFAGTLGYAQSYWADALHLGLAATAAQESLSGQPSTIYTAALQGLYDLPGGLTLGLGGSDLRLGGDGGGSPAVWHAALGWRSPGRALGAAFQYDRPVAGDGSLRLGAEWAVAGDYFLRGGWRFAQGEGSAQDAGFSVGAGVNLGSLRLDYAYAPQGVFGATQRLGATLTLGEGLFGGKVIIEAGGTSEAAQAAYKAGMAAYDRKDWTEAKVTLSEVLTLQPGFAKADDINRLLGDLGRRISAEKAAAASGGLSKEQKSNLARKLNDAHAYYAQKQYVLAKNKLQEIFEFDTTLKEAVALKHQLDDSIRDRVAQLNKEAIAALQDDDLAVAVDRLRQALMLDGQDQGTRSRLVKLHPRVAEEVRHLHRLGIDAYLANDWNKAIDLWQRALQLDPSDPMKVGHDLDKARKMKDFHDR